MKERQNEQNPSDRTASKTPSAIDSESIPLLISTGFLKYSLELKKKIQLELKKKIQLELKKKSVSLYWIFLSVLTEILFHFKPMTEKKFSENWKKKFS